MRRDWRGDVCFGDKLIKADCGAGQTLPRRFALPGDAAPGRLQCLKSAIHIPRLNQQVIGIICGHRSHGYARPGQCAGHAREYAYKRKIELSRDAEHLIIVFARVRV